MFVRPIIGQTNVLFKILELHVITFGTGPNGMPYEFSKWQWAIYFVLLMSRN